MTSTDLKVQAGEPFARQVRVVGAASIWPTTDDVEARMQVVRTAYPHAVFDMTPHLVVAIETDDVLVSWDLPGITTREFIDGQYDLFLSDPGVVDARAIRVLYGQIRVNAAVTTGADT